MNRLIFELCIYLISFMVIFHAVSVKRTAYIIGGIVYGLVAEYVVINLIDAYKYGAFLVSYEGLPLAIGLSWGILIYCAMYITDITVRPWYLRPFIDALTVLIVDLSMDAIAIRLGLWNWTNGGYWFGVPLGNFFAWYCLVFLYSWLNRQFIRIIRHWIIQVIIIPSSTLLLISLLSWYSILETHIGAWSASGVTVLLIVISIICVYRADKSSVSNLRVLQIPLLALHFFHIYFLLALVSIIEHENVIALAMISIAVYIGHVLIQKRLTQST